MDASALKQAFPSADPGVRPLGSRILVQVRTPPAKSSGGILLTQNDRDTEKWNTQVAKVVSLGPLAFRNRNTQESWPEGRWCEVGDYVRVPKYGGDRWEVATERDDEPAMFALFNDLELLAKVESDPLAVKAFF